LRLILGFVFLAGIGILLTITFKRKNTKSNNKYEKNIDSN
jgi:hypothetical protein